MARMDAARAWLVLNAVGRVTVSIGSAMLTPNPGWHKLRPPDEFVFFAPVARCGRHFFAMAKQLLGVQLIVSIL